MFLFVLIAAIAFNIWIAVSLANDQPNDGKLYTQIAKNLIETGVFSAETEAPFTPTLIRLPGYPLFLAAVYAAAGTDTAVRVIQAILYTLASIMGALLARNWLAGTRLSRRKAAFWTFILAAFCPFTAIFSATILTETLTMFFLAAMALAATYAIKTSRRTASGFWWLMSGIAAGTAVLLRPDSGLFALGIGLSLVLSLIFLKREELTILRRSIDVMWKGAVFTAAFILVLVPWTIRNERVFGIFQPLAPAHAEMPGEFVPRGYLLWVRTWIDDSKYIGPMLWDLEEKPIEIGSIPPYAFASEEERLQVASLLDQYSHSDPDQQAAVEDPNPTDDETDDSTDSNDDQPDTDTTLNLKISPEVDAAFEQIAQQRIRREPWHFYAWLPAKRAASMWFDTHSEYYPFGGEIFPVKDLDNEKYQNIWLPFFGALTWIYTVLALGGAIILFLYRRSRLWLFMAILLCLPRIAFFGTLENPEPRYLVELFIVAAVLGGIALSRFQIRRRNGSLAFEFRYRSVR